MKILFSITYYTPYVSGLTLYVRRLAETLAQNHRVTVISMQHNPGLPREETINRVSVVRAKPIVAVSKGFLSLDWIFKSYELVREHDVVVVNLPQPEGIVLALFARLWGKRLVAIYHCEVVLPSGFFNSLIQVLLELANIVSLILAQKVVTYTIDFANHSKLLRRVHWKVVAIYPPMPKPRIDTSLQKKLAKKIGPADVVIGVAARLAAEKGIEYLLEAIPEIQFKISNLKSKIVLAGLMEPVGEAAYKTKIMKLVKKYKKHVVFLGEIKPEHMGSFYRLLDVLVLPSINSTEAFGMVQVEAMLTGVPVVASDLPGVRVPIQKTGMGLVVPSRNSKKLAEAIMAIRNNRKLYVKNSGTIQQYFSTHESVKAFETLCTR